MQAESDVVNLVGQRAVWQLQEYFAGGRKSFDLSLKSARTPFLRAVYQALQKVPFGQTTTYAALAASSGYPGAARAVGNAMARNPLSIIVPCHRVLARAGEGGYAGGLPRKRWLLQHENRYR